MPDIPPAAPPSPRKGRIYSIAPGAPFLAELARALAGGRLIAGLGRDADPLALAGATVYLPTRRAARAFAGELVEALGAGAALLPSIRTLGDGEEEEFAIVPQADETGEDILLLPPAAGEMERLLELASLVQAWRPASRPQAGVAQDGRPAPLAVAIALARELAGLLDRMETEEIDWRRIGDIIGEEHAEWYALTAEFLAIVTEQWPAHRAATGRVDAAHRRNLLLHLRASRIAAGQTGPVVIAGTTGSIPATRRLVAAALGRADCAVVLPGLDLALPEKAWRELAKPAGDEAAALAQTHAQAGLARLLFELGASRSEVTPLGDGAPDRERLVASALLPARLTSAWANLAENAGADAAPEFSRDTACAGIFIVEAPGEREEALAIAIAMREAVETPGRTAALVTPDRNLARRVAAELARFAIRVDDSAGLPLPRSEAGRLALQVAALRHGEANRVTLAAVLKHPAVCGAAADAARVIEITALRDDLPPPAAGALAAALTDAQARARTDPHAHPVVRDLDEATWRAAAIFAARADEALGAPPADDSLPQAAADLAAALRRLAEDERALAQLEGYSALGDFLAELARQGDPGAARLLPATRANEIPAALEALMAAVTVREASPAHPRLAILGPLEARLLHYDLMILGGLNEGVWPPAARNDPFLNRPMRGEIGMSMPERRIGQAAHDFAQGCGATDVLLTRPGKAKGAPTVASRFLQRLRTAAGASAASAMAARGQRFLALAAMLDRDAARAERRLRKAPCPTPPLELRPRRLSVTEIETLIRDPYAIYAKHVLGLIPLPPLDPEIGARLRGSLYHAILADFVRDQPAGETGENAGRRLALTAKRHFSGMPLPPELRAAWLPRFLEIGRLFLEWEAGRRGNVRASFCEISGKVAVGANVGPEGFVLAGRADRIDVFADGRLAIFDYKTGTRPSIKQAKLFSPQLLLEARMAALGGFGPLAQGEVAEAAYIRLRRNSALKIDRIGGDLGDLATERWQQLERLIAAYRNPAQGYRSRYAVEKEGEAGGDYDHLARVREWSTAGDSEDADG
jgi:ATP-dependent helicase/nuclease subunit B